MKLYVQKDGVYIDPDESGFEHKLDGGVALIDSQTGDLVIRFGPDVIVVREPIDPYAAYNMTDPEVRRIAVDAGVITQGEANRLGRVDGTTAVKEGGGQ